MGRIAWVAVTVGLIAGFASIVFFYNRVHSHNEVRLDISVDPQQLSLEEPGWQDFNISFSNKGSELEFVGYQYC